MLRVGLFLHGKLIFSYPLIPDFYKEILDSAIAAFEESGEYLEVKIYESDMK